MVCLPCFSSLVKASILVAKIDLVQIERERKIDRERKQAHRMIYVRSLMNTITYTHSNNTIG